MRTEWAFLAGLGVGTVAGLMIAPQSGKDTQELLAGKLRDWTRSQLRSRIWPSEVQKTSRQPSTQAKRLIGHPEPGVRRLSNGGRLWRGFQSFPS